MATLDKAADLFQKMSLNSSCDDKEDSNGGSNNGGTGDGAVVSFEIFAAIRDGSAVEGVWTLYDDMGSKMVADCPSAVSTRDFKTTDVIEVMLTGKIGTDIRGWARFTHRVPTTGQVVLPMEQLVSDDSVWKLVGISEPGGNSIHLALERAYDYLSLSPPNLAFFGFDLLSETLGALQCQDTAQGGGQWFIFITILFLMIKPSYANRSS